MVFEYSVDYGGGWELQTGESLFCNRQAGRLEQKK